MSDDALPALSSAAEAAQVRQVQPGQCRARAVRKGGQYARAGDTQGLQGRALRHSCINATASSSLMSGRCFSRISGRARWLPNPGGRQARR